MRNTTTTTPWQPDWRELNGIAAAFVASTPLATQIAAATPPGAYVANGLQCELGDILTAAAKVSDPLVGPLVIAVDTLFVPAGDTTVVTPGVAIVARSVQVVGDGPANLILRGASSAFQLTTAQIVGPLAVGFQDANGAPVNGGAMTALALAGLQVPQVLSLASATPDTVTHATDSTTIADVMHSPWSVLALSISGAIAGALIDDETAEAMALAAAMLRWVTASSQALLQHQQSYTTVDWSDIASQLTAALGLLTFTQTAASNATYVPILSGDLYQAQINGLLGLARTYDQKITALQARQNIDEQLAAFARTLGDINQQAAAPLLNTLANLANQTGLVETQLQNAAVQLQQIGSTLPDLQAALEKAISDEFQHELVKTALDTFFTLLTLYVGVAAALVDPALLTGDASAVLKAALDVTKELIQAGQEALNAAINDGSPAAGEAPTTASIEAAKQGAQVMATSITSFSQAVAVLWTLVDAAIAQAPAHINYSPDFLSAVEKLPDLSDFTTGGLDPVTYWNAVVIQTEAAVQPNINLPEAGAYLEAVKLAATYGAAVGDLQMKLLDLYTQGMSAFTRLQAVYQAQDQWNRLQGALAQQEQQLAAAIGLLQRGYLNVKRDLVVAVDNYRAAFAYQWLQSSDIRVDVSMDYLTLEQQAQSSITSLQKVLAGTTGGAVRPRQTFNGIGYTVTRVDAPLFTSVDGKGLAQWSITLDDPTLSAQLGGNTALYLTEATFVLEGAAQTGEVELEISTSGRYANQLGGAQFRFVSQAVSMNNFYQPDPFRFVTTWSFANPAAYMAPAPYTNWTLRVVQGAWENVSAIKMTLSGVFLQNP